MEVKWPCGKCGKTAKYNSIQCKMLRCRKWYHPKCANVNPRNLPKIVQNEIEVVDWKCEKCNADAEERPTTPTAENQQKHGPRRKSAPCKSARLQFRFRNLPREDAPPTQRKKMRKREQCNFTILQWNCAGVRAKKVQLEKLIEEKQPHIILLQETKLTEETKFRPPSGYNCIRKERNTRRNENAGGENTHGGVMTLIHSNLNYKVVDEVMTAPTDEISELLVCTVQVPGRRPIRVINAYIPPIKPGEADTRVDNFDPNALKTSRDTIVAGDMNGHSAAWSPDQPEDERGRRLDTWAIDTGFLAANTGISTKATSKSAPDITFVHGHCINSFTWTVLEDNYTSDHLPIVCTFPANNPMPRRLPTKWSFKKADWLEFREKLEGVLEIDIADMKIHEVWKIFKKYMIETAEASIPRGRRKDAKAWWNERAEELTTERKELMKRVKEEGTAEVKAQFNALNRETAKEINDMKAESWRSYATTLDARSKVSEVFRVMNRIEGKGRTEHPSTPLMNGQTELRTDRAKAGGFVKVYKEVSEIQISKQEKMGKRNVIAAINGKCECERGEEDGSANRGACVEYTMPELKAALNKLKIGKAPGADGITNEMLKHLGPVALQFLLKLINLSWRSKDLPADWKKATIIPLLKPGKPAHLPGSYRPIALTSCVVKLMERLVQERMTYMLESANVLNCNQAGFRSLRSTEDQCIRISQQIANGFNERPSKRTVLCLVDFKRAYDTVWKAALYEKLQECGLPCCYLKWTQQFLSDRYARVQYGTSTSGYKRFAEGLPQGAVLSPTLFLCFINDITKNIPDGVEASLFADDLALWSQHEDKEQAEVKLQAGLDVLSEWSAEYKLQISAEKTELAFFSNASNEAQHQPWLQLNGRDLGFTKNPRFLGVVYDRQLTFAAHIDNIKKKMKSRTKVMQALRGKHWGIDKEDMRLVYLAYVRSAADYCASAWATSATATQLKKIETEQNAAARIITNCCGSTPVDGLLTEAGLMPYADRKDELAAIALERSYRLTDDNPRRQVAEFEAPKRLKRGNWRNTAARVVEDAGIAILPREHFVPYATIPPWRRTALTTFREDLDVMIKRTDPDEMKADAARKQIENLSGAALDIYTDGSAVEGNKNGGGGALIIDNVHEEEYEMKAPAGKLTCSYRAEQVAINIALQKIMSLQRNGKLAQNAKINMFTDSRSSVQKLARGAAKQQLANSNLTLIEEIAKAGNPQITLQWIPAHCGVEGNERVDSIAKEATSLSQDAAPVDFDSAKARIRAHCKKTWEERRKTPVLGAKYVDKKKEEGLTTAERTTLSRFRTGGHTPELNWYKHLVTRNDEERQSPLCRRCNVKDETLSHVMVDCVSLQTQRLVYFEGMDPMQALFEKPKEAIGFLRAGGILAARPRQ